MRPFVLLLVLVGALAPPPAAAAPLTVGDLLALWRVQISSEAILTMARAEGLASALSVAEATSLREAGLPADLVSELLTLGSGAAIRVGEDDGVIVVEGRGEATDPPVVGSGFLPTEPAPPAASPSPAVVVNVQATPAMASGGGWGCGPLAQAVFVPAHRTPDGPSVFGTTIVSPGIVCPQLVQPIVLAPEPVRSRMIPIRTSRGQLMIPN